MLRALRYFVVVSVATTSLVAVVGSSAQATKEFAWHQHNSHAAATWLLDDAYNTAISVYAYDATSNQVSGRPNAAGDLVGVDIYQGYCDTANSQWVDRSWYGSALVDVSVASDMTAANWPAVAVPLSGSETDTPFIGGSCDNLDWENATTTDLTSSQLTLAGLFTAAGPMVTENSSRHDTYDPYLWVTVTAGRARMATAVTVPMSASDWRLAALGSLPTPDFAYVGHTVRIELTVTRGHNHRATGTS